MFLGHLYNFNISIPVFNFIVFNYSYTDGFSFCLKAGETFVPKQTYDLEYSINNKYQTLAINYLENQEKETINIYF